MTVIFHTNAKAPVLAGDMLVSMQGWTKPTGLRLPSQPNGIIVPPNEIPEYVPVKMRRKVFVVNDRIAVGAAGSVSHLATFIRRLSEDFDTKIDCTLADVRAWLNSFTSTQLGVEVSRQIGALILIEDAEGCACIQFGAGTPANLDSRLFGHVTAIGTGAATVVDQIGQLDTYRYGGGQSVDSQHKFREFSTLADNLNLLANLYYNEFASPSNIFQAWGGAYDLIYQNAHKHFQYLNGYTMFLRFLDAKEPNGNIRLANVFKYERRPCASIVAMLNNGKLNFFGAKDITANDEPLAVRVGGQGFTLNSQVHISILAVGVDNRYLAPLIQIDGLGPTEERNQAFFTSFSDSGQLEVYFESKIDELLVEQAMIYYRDRAHLFS